MLMFKSCTVATLFHGNIRSISNVKRQYMLESSHHKLTHLIITAKSRPPRFPAFHLPCGISNIAAMKIDILWEPPIPSSTTYLTHGCPLPTLQLPCRNNDEKSLIKVFTYTQGRCMRLANRCILCNA
jgi:hypothetical protein